MGGGGAAYAAALWPLREPSPCGSGTGGAAGEVAGDAETTSAAFIDPAIAPPLPMPPSKALKPHWRRRRSMSITPM